MKKTAVILALIMMSMISSTVSAEKQWIGTIQDTDFYVKIDTYQHDQYWETIYVEGIHNHRVFRSIKYIFYQTKDGMYWIGEERKKYFAQGLVREHDFVKKIFTIMRSHHPYPFSGNDTL